MKKFLVFLMALGMVLAIIPMENVQGRGGRRGRGGRSGGLRRSGGGKAGNKSKNAQIQKDRTGNEYNYSFNEDCVDLRRMIR